VFRVSPNFVRGSCTRFKSKPLTKGSLDFLCQALVQEDTLIEATKKAKTVCLLPPPLAQATVGAKRYRKQKASPAGLEPAAFG
jgi:hypothetical protein